MKKAAVFFSILALAAGLGCGLVRLFAIRFAQGDIYPPYSTLRADGLGSKALHDSLAELMPVERNYQPLSELKAGGESRTIFLLGVGQGFEYSADVETLARNGCRVVLAFLPYQRKPHEEPPDAVSPPESSGTNAGEKKAEEKKTAGLHKQLGEETAFAASAPEHAKAKIPGVEPELSWHSTLYFDKLDPAWHTLYTCGGKPVVIERVSAKGSIVLAGDAYFSSNEALGKERAPGLISALAGNSGTVVFDETHLGVYEHPGVASLVRKYRLHGVVVALILVAALFVWRNAVAFVPGEAEVAARRGDFVRGFDAAAGFVSLLKRNIPFYKLTETCVAEWKRSFGHRTKAATVAQVETLAVTGRRQPVQTFQTIMQILNEKK